MKAFHGDVEIKNTYLNRVIAHQKADKIVKGKYWENGKGCAVGCTVHSGDHSAYERELGIPRVLARLEDGIFESLPNDLAVTWPKRFLEAIKPGADLSKVWAKFAIYLLIDDNNGVIKYANTDKTKLVINNVAGLYLRYLKEEVTIMEFTDASISAYAAFDYTSDTYTADAAADADADAAYTAYAAAYAAYTADADAAYYADAAADAADTAVYTAARAACRLLFPISADVAAARTKARIAQSEKLLELLRETE